MAREEEIIARMVFSEEVPGTLRLEEYNTGGNRRFPRMITGMYCLCYDKQGRTMEIPLKFSCPAHIRIEYMTDGRIKFLRINRHIKDININISIENSGRSFFRDNSCIDIGGEVYKIEELVLVYQGKKNLGDLLSIDLIRKEDTEETVQMK